MPVVIHICLISYIFSSILNNSHKNTKIYAYIIFIFFFYILPGNWMKGTKKHYKTCNILWVSNISEFCVRKYSNILLYPNSCVAIFFLYSKKIFVKELCMLFLLFLQFFSWTYSNRSLPPSILLKWIMSVFSLIVNFNT